MRKAILILAILFASTAADAQVWTSSDMTSPITQIGPSLEGDISGYTGGYLLYKDTFKAKDVIFQSIESDYENVCFELNGDTKRCISLNELYRILVIRDAKKEAK